MSASKRRGYGLGVVFGIMVVASAVGGHHVLAEGVAGAQPARIDGLPYSTAFHVVELRRYTTTPGQREKFARYFDAWFPEAFQQVGALAVGQFLEQDKGDGFTWMRAFQSMEDFAIAKSSFYYGPVWQEHKTTLNNLLVDNDNVLLLTPLGPDGIAVLPAMDPVFETKPNRGLVIAQLIKAKPEALSEVTRLATAAFEKYRAAGARQAALLVTLKSNNTFPQHVIRTDGPFLVWVGVIPEDASIKNRIVAQMAQEARELTATSMLQESPETIVLTPTPRSRLRWLSDAPRAGAP